MRCQFSSNLSEPNLISLDESAVTDGSVDNFSIGTGDMSTLSTSVRLSTTSIASSASSHGSAASVEALPIPIKSRSNSSASATTSAGGSVQEELKAGQAMASTGAIPKSISFDKSADKDEEVDKVSGGVLNKRDRNFFKNWKLPKIGRNRGGGRGSKVDEYRSSDRLTQDAFNIPEHAEGPILRRTTVDDGKVESGPSESSDDILAKYRKPERQAKTEETLVNITKAGDEVDGAELDLANLDTSVIFQDAKRKLRLMLAEVSLLKHTV